MHSALTRVFAQLTLVLLALSVVVGPRAQVPLGQLVSIVQVVDFEESGESQSQSDSPSPEPGDAEADTDEVPDALLAESLELRFEADILSLAMSDSRLLKPWREPRPEIARPPRG